MIRGVAMGEVFSSESFDTFKVWDGNKEALEACKRVAAGGERGVVLLERIGAASLICLSRWLVSSTRFIRTSLAKIAKKNPSIFLH